MARLAAELIPGIGPDFNWTVADNPESLKEGRVDIFWLADLDRLEVYESRFELALVSPHAYWYVEVGGEANRADLERSAEAFEERIYPAVTAVFGSEWSPGVDGDPRVTIVNGSLRSVGGYFNSSDEYPRAVFSYSNQREMIYINTSFIPIGSVRLTLRPWPMSSSTWLTGTMTLPRKRGSTRDCPNLPCPSRATGLGTSDSGWTAFPPPWSTGRWTRKE